MIPIADDNPTLRTPVVTYGLLLTIALVWIFVQGAGLLSDALAASVCDLGLVAGEVTGLAPVGQAVPLGEGMYCVVDRQVINYLTPLTSMFLHGGWGHLLSNSLFLWVFGNNVEDSMGRLRFLVFYVLCGLTAAAAQVLVEPGSPVPMVGASGAISGVMGAYLLLYPRVRVHMLFIFFVVPLPAWLVLIWWFALQVIAALPDLAGIEREVSSGVAVMAHVGGFLAGLLLVKPFENDALVDRRRRGQHPSHTHWVLRE